MGKLKRMKELAKKIKQKLQQAVTNVATWTVKNAPKIMNTIVKMIGIADRTGIRKILINLVPEAGPYINIVIDYLLEAHRLGIVDQICDILQHALTKDITIEDFINKAKTLLNTVKNSIKQSFDAYRNIKKTKDTKPQTVKNRENLNKIMSNQREELDEYDDYGEGSNALDVFGESINN